MGSEGKQAKNVIAGSAGAKGLQDIAAAGQDPRVMQAMQQYSSGGSSLQDALKGLSGAEQQQLFLNPATGGRAAAEQVQQNPLLSGFYGQGGMQEQMLGEQKDLAGKGYSLQPQDYEAYGQASDQAARMFGQEESSIANALASRGLASAPSGAAGVAYSGLAGNKNERLAQAQRSIANDRMKTNMDRLNSVRGQLMQSNQLAQQAQGSQFGRNQEGRSALKDALSASQTEQGQENIGFEQEQATKGPSFGDLALGLGGKALGTLGGGLGGMASDALGSIFKPKSPFTGGLPGLQGGMPLSGGKY